MTEKRFNVFDVDGTVFLEDHKLGSYHICEIEDVDMPCLNDIADRLNNYAEENEQLKKELFEERKDYILETYADNSIRRDEKLKALEKELRE